MSMKGAVTSPWLTPCHFLTEPTVNVVIPVDIIKVMKIINWQNETMSTFKKLDEQFASTLN